MKDYQELYEKFKRNLEENDFSEENIAIIDKAFKLAQEAHKEQYRYSGEAYIIHPINVAQILLDLGMDIDTLTAALLHDCVEDTDVTLEDIKKEFSEEVAYLVNGVTKLSKIVINTTEERQAENLRKMLLAMADDIRVIIIKLADRLHNMKTLEFMKKQKQRDKALETLEIYAPIAHRLGIMTIKNELEDLSLRYLDPIAYIEIEKLTEQKLNIHKNFIDDIILKINFRLKDNFPDAHIEGRVKSINGIYRKMYMQNKTFDEIFDFFAIRVIVSSVLDCYNILGIVHDMFHSMPGRFKDYISIPKSNMYQSIHTTVLSEDGQPFEIQIRTWDMHYSAEYGIAAHWKYKVNDLKADQMDERISWVRQLIENQDNADDFEDIVKTIKSEFANDEVFVFTPQGEIKSFPLGSTVLDFAYAIHTDVGHKTIGAKADGKIVQLDYKMKTGQIIEILTTKSAEKGPSRDWLNFVKTSSAKTKIRLWFKKEKRTENIENGKNDIIRLFKNNNIRAYDEDYDEIIRHLYEKYHFSNADDFYAAIGYGSLTASKFLPAIKDEYQKLIKKDEEEITPIPNITQEVSSTAADNVISISDIDNCLIKFSKCCNPIPGDDIIGFITRGHGISIHTKDCPNVPKTFNSKEEKDRWIEVNWNKTKGEYFQASLLITGTNRLGLLADITSRLASLNIMLCAVRSRDIEENDMTQIDLTINVKNVDQLYNLMFKLGSIPGIVDVKRSGGY
ncbi:MAG: bifunctional (p)ppGpp synthetase/guanosine-3',5'-bis(diphosphate) 3'-pyrophosphohydrolase [Clostridia bacterium]|nr:bifunctional (p)ppGpp synthetase/guanosine-3',5'-bis(diphosphate) 3'-pyrophosphohydrolase [Clostridia bacterium]